MGEFLRDLWAFMRVRKRYWLLSIIRVRLLLGGLVVVSQQSALASLICTAFWAVREAGKTRDLALLVLRLARCRQGFVQG